MTHLIIDFELKFIIYKRNYLISVTILFNKNIKNFKN